MKCRIPQRRGVRNFVLMIMFRTMCCFYLIIVICEHAESWKYFIYIHESGDYSLLTRSMCVAIPAFLTLAFDFIQLPALFSFRNGRELPGPFFFSQWAWVHGHFPYRNGRELPWPFFFSQFFHNGLELPAHFPFRNGLELPAKVYPRQLFTSRRCLKWFCSPFSFLALFLSPIACQNPAALSDFVSSLLPPIALFTMGWIYTHI